MLIDLVWIPITAMSLAITMAALLAKSRFYWHDAERTFFTKLSFTVFVVALMFCIGWVEWYLMHRLIASALSVL